MSQENVQVIRAAQEAWNHRARHGGVAGAGAWDADTLVPTSNFIDVGDRVVTRTRWDAVGQGPGINMEFTQVFTVRKGKIVGAAFFWNHAEALEAVGLSEQDAHTDS
jgi:ketosteroid isomerase-like protein